MDTTQDRIPILIPAYRPNARLLALVQALASPMRPVIVVDDGSGQEFRPVFDAVSSLQCATVLRHAVNLGKGAALKTGINHILCEYPDATGVVTADADGQHHPEDILRVGSKLAGDHESLVLGVRELDADVPLRSRFGNWITRVLVRLLIGQRLSDTQTGLRAIPRSLLPVLLTLPANGYEFELDMLIACRHQDCPLRQESIRTIYFDGNRSSHFNPVVDSMRIYFVLLRFSLASLATAAVDNLVFYGVFPIVGVIWQAQAAGRIVAMAFNYGIVRRTVFHSRQLHREVLPKYLSLVAISGSVSYALLQFLHAHTHLGIMASKITAETLLFAANFAIQRDFIFKKRRALRDTIVQRPTPAEAPRARVSS